MYELIDTHAHLDEVKNLGEVIDRARDAGLIAIIAVGVDYASNNRILEMAERYKSFVFPALGCHPQNLGKTSEEIEHNLQFIEDNIERVVAVGEIGLDYHKKVIAQASKDTQKRVLKDVLELAKRFGKPVSVHSRYSWRDCFTCIQEVRIEKAVFHWYTGPMNVLRDILGEGYSASATLAAEYHEEHRRAIKEIPLGKFMLETDSPVLYRWGTEFAHPSEPADVALRVLPAVATIKAVDSTLMAERTTKNAISFFGLSNPGAE